MFKAVFFVCLLVFAIFGTATTVFALDSDEDGLNDSREEIMGTDPIDPDTDSDGYLDGEEIEHLFDPLDPRPKRAKKTIQVDLSKQKLSYHLGLARMGEMIISSGKWNWPTPTGSFAIINKDKRAWSRLASLWMPYWMGFKGGRFGIHELPEWPNGRKEGKDHLGKPVSHGCIRLGEGDAKKLFEWTPVGAELIIRK